MTMRYVWTDPNKGERGRPADVAGVEKVDKG